MDTLYSAYKRWKTLPEQYQNEWYIAYHNLKNLEKLCKRKLTILRYEDMVSSINSMSQVFNFCGIDITSADNNYMHQKSIHKWKNDRLYGFQLSPHIVELARSYGYKKDELINRKNIIWPLQKRLARVIYKAKHSINNSIRMVPKRNYDKR